VERTPLKVEVDETLARKWSGYPPVVEMGAPGQRRSGKNEKKL
jgi:hypothetical protein